MNFDVSGRCGGVEPRVALYGEHLRQGLLRSFLMRCGFVGEVGGDEESGDFLFLVGEGAEVGDALELLEGEGGFLDGRGSPVRWRVARVLRVSRPLSTSCWMADQVDSSMTRRAGGLPRQSVCGTGRPTAAARVEVTDDGE